MMTVRRAHARVLAATCVLAALALVASPPSGADGIDAARLAALRRASGIAMSPDGSRVAYVLSVPRRPGVDEDGAAWRELHVVRVDGGDDRAWIHGKVSISEVQFTPDGSQLFYLAKRGDDKHKAVWSIPLDGGESRKVVSHGADVSTFRVSPDAQQIAFVAKEAEPKARKRAKKKGYKQEVYEEDWRPTRLWIAGVKAGTEARDPSSPDGETALEPRALPLQGSAFEVEWAPDGRTIAVTIAATPLIDDRYMARRIWIVDASTGEVRSKIDNPGKLGKFRFSPDGRRISMISAADPNDPREGRLLVAATDGGEPRDLLPGLEGHVRDIAWQDAQTVMLVLDVGVETELVEVDVETGERKRHLASTSGSPVLSSLSLSADGQRAALVGETPTHPSEVYAMAHGQVEPRRLTDSNPWLERVELARQTVFRWRTRDGLDLEGLLLYPLIDQTEPSPLLLMVHGGPEAHDRNGWVTSYSRPGQLAAARGYFVLYPNYRGSTGRGVAFSKTSQADAAGREFDDLVDAIGALVESGLVDRDRVGITGGSYGGYATAWCSTRHTEHFRAGVMFVGISNKLSKGFTTEIPVEDRMVHTLFDPWTRWQFSLERSPLYHAEQSRTALLIATGTDDTRVHPSQSLQLYRALKLIGKTPVRHVRYPGEGHGNRKAAARDDYTRRLMRWMDHFVMGQNAELPPWELALPLLDEDDENGDE